MRDEGVGSSEPTLPGVGIPDKFPRMICNDVSIHGAVSMDAFWGLC